MEGYNVKYKRGLFWKTVKGIVADGFIEEFAIRFFILKDGRRVEVPTEGTVFMFSKERDEIIKREQANKTEK
jgi:hypothetical protein